MDTLIGYLGRGRYALAKEFKIAEEEIKKGSETNSALLNIMKRNQGRNIVRVVQLMKTAETTGNVKPAMFREAANELLKDSLLSSKTA